MRLIDRLYPLTALIAGVLMLCASGLAPAQSAPMGLRWDVSLVDFGIRAVGSTPEVRTVTLTNTASSVVPVSPITVANSDYTQFGLVGHDCPAEMAAGASCQIQVRFVPVAESAGATVTGVIVVGEYFTQAQLPLRGIVESPLGLARIEIQMMVTGTARVISYPAGISCELPVSPCIGYLPIGASAVLHAMPRYDSIFTGWEGPCTGAGTCNFTVEPGTTHVRLQGRAVTPTLVPTPKVVAFESRGIQTRSLTLRNTSTAPVQVTGMGTNDARFSLAPVTCTVSPGGECVIPVNYVPDGAPVAGAVVNLITSAGAFYVPIDVDEHDSLVGHFYESILRRAPDTAGHEFWNDEARRLAMRAEMVEVWVTMASRFFDSDEYRALARDNDGFILDLYSAFMARTPSSEELGYWSDIARLYPHLPRQALVTTFAFSPEFKARASSAFEARPEVNLVMDLYRGILRRLPDEAGLRHWVPQLRLAQCSGADAVYAFVDGMSRGFLSSFEYQQRATSNAQYVTDLYDAFMRRGPDTAGFNFWFLALNNQPRDQVRAFFQASPEFQARVQAVVAAGCHPWPSDI